MVIVNNGSSLDAETARKVRRLDFIEAEAEVVRTHFTALESDPVHGETLARLPQLPELLDNYLKLMFEEADIIRRTLGTSSKELHDTSSTLTL